MTQELVLTFPAPAMPISENEARGRHWGSIRKRTGPWKDMAWVVARQAIREAAQTKAPWTPQPVDILVVIPFRTRRRRDPHNFVGTVVKAVVDGLVHAEVIPDDTPEWATIIEPRLDIQPDRSVPMKATVYITPRSSA